MGEWPWLKDTGGESTKHLNVKLYLYPLGRLLYFETTKELSVNCKSVDRSKVVF